MLAFSSCPALPSPGGERPPSHCADPAPSLCGPGRVLSVLLLPALIPLSQSVFCRVPLDFFTSRCGCCSCLSFVGRLPATAGLVVADSGGWSTTSKKPSATSPSLSLNCGNGTPWFAQLLALVVCSCSLTSTRSGCTACASSALACIVTPGHSRGAWEEPDSPTSILTGGIRRS